MPREYMISTSAVTPEIQELIAYLRQGQDPIIDGIIDLIPRKKFQRTLKNNRRTNRYTRKYQTRNFAQQIPGRDSLTIVRFLREDGYAEIRIQRDIEENGELKGKPGFVIGSPDFNGESDEAVSKRETVEETLISPTVGTVQYVGVIQSRHNYYTSVFVRTVPFNTPDGKGEDVYDHYRASVDEVAEDVKNRLLLSKHCAAFIMALENGHL